MRFEIFACAVGLVLSTGCSSGDGAEGPPPDLRPGVQACGGGACIQAASCRPGQASAQFRSQVPPPADMIPGTRAWASVTFDNCSGQTWTQTDFALRPNAPSDEGTWGLGRVMLPADVPDGGRVTIPFEVTAPTAAGVYPFTWKIEGIHSGSLQEHSPLEEVTVHFSADCTKEGPASRFLSWTVPSFVEIGKPVHATVTFANCSVSRWTKEDGFALGSQADPDNTTWGVSRVDLPNEVPSQTSITIPVEVTAPATPGAYKFAWKIVQEGKEWLEESTPVATIYALEGYDCSSSGPLSRFVREDGVPGDMNPGQGFSSSVTFANCSPDPWTSAFHIGAAKPSTDGIWGAGDVALPFPVAPGYAITTIIHGNAPGSPGTYPYRWTVIHDGVGPLDQPSPQHDITVRCIPSCGDHNCGGDGCGGSCGGCGDGYSCDGAYCKEIPHALSCSHLQWWNSYITYFHMSYGWYDTDLGVAGSTPVQLRHDSRLDKHGVYAWGYMPEFTDMVTGKRFRLLHLRPANQYATSNGTIYPAGYVVGLSGGDTADTGLGPYSTGAHLCVQTLEPYRNVFPAGHDACK
jgi:hypothetical protein